MDSSAETLTSTVAASAVPLVPSLTGQPCPLCAERVQQVVQADSDLRVLKPCGCAL
ncbi:hypothetical protein [Actinomadura sp. 6N118]|uniref:hypothetical protein n=1 Tax=Actinomadura sp. 6N118 TaxID=3375151 RepID=UPI0037AE5D5E